MFTLDIDTMDCFKNAEKMYRKMYVSRKWRRRDAAILPAAAACRSVMTGGGGGGGAHV